MWRAEVFLMKKNVPSLSLLAFVAGTAFALTGGARADDHGKAEPPPAEHGGGGGGEGHGGGEAKPTYAPPPAAKSVSLKNAPAKPKAEAPAEPPAATTPVKPVSNLKPVQKGAAKNAPASEPSAEAVADGPRSAEEALTLLREGNQRWVEGSVQNPSAGALRRKVTAESGQKPFAVVLTCADSRIPVERVFDRGVGEVFTARVAGNVSGPHECGTIEYALEHLNVPVLVVMGHSKCGAVKATAENAQVTPNIMTLVESIRPAVERTHKLYPSLEGAEFVEAAVRENVWQSVFDLYKNSPATVEMVKSGKVKVVGAVLDISTGKVEWMGEHPWQDAIVGAFSSRSGTPETAAKGEQGAQGPVEKTANAEPAGH